VEQLNIFSYILPQYKITKPIRLIELFAGIGSQAKALKNLGANFEHYRVVEWDKYAINSYNSVHGTTFTTSDITKIKGSDLGIVDTHLYDYILTYSFPCTDISLAGKMGGMSKGTNTRSGLLWEVERLLDECKELPQILLMENVPQIISKQNIADFQDWQYKLEQLGYLNYVSLLNAKDYGIPQNRNRCFMVSILGKYYYKFPHKQELKLRLKDMLEDEVDEKYYLSETAIYDWFVNKVGMLIEDCDDYDGGENLEHKVNVTDKTLCLNSKVNGKQPSVQNRIYDTNAISTAITTSFMPSIAIPEATKKGYALAKEGDGIYINRPHQKRGTVQKGMIQTIKTNGNDIGVVVKSKPEFGRMGKQAVDTMMKNEVKLGDTINPYNRNVNISGIIPTITTRPEGLKTAILPIVQNKEDNTLAIRKLTPKECWRLMGFSDEDFEKASKVNSNTQLYKQAGNSIVVNVLMAIFKELL
jgi:DNA (cytosine-5)-methyltransferase 1